MTLAAQRSGGRGGSIVEVLRAMLTLVLLVPTIILFRMVWQTTIDDSQTAKLERHGVAYIDTLITLEMSLGDAQAAALTNGPAVGDQLNEAVAAVNGADSRYGDELRTSERWAALRTKILALPDRNAEDTTIRYAQYAEATDLLLALVEKVRSSARLIRDPDTDAFYLQDAAAQELTDSIADASQLADLAILTSAQPANDQTAALPNLPSLRASLLSNATDLANDVRQAVDTTRSSTLGSNLLNPLDRFRQAVDSLVPSATTLQGRTLIIDQSKLTKARAEARTAADTLADAMLGEIDGLIANRVDALDQRLTVTVGTMAAAVLVALLAPAVAIRRVRRRRRPYPAAAAGGPGAGTPSAGTPAGTGPLLPGRAGPGYGPAPGPSGGQASGEGAFPGGGQASGGSAFPGGSAFSGGSAPGAPPHSDLAAITSWERSGVPR